MPEDASLILAPASLIGEHAKVVNYFNYLLNPMGCLTG